VRERERESEAGGGGGREVVAVVFNALRPKNI
jgi:hypothetical protein